MNAELWGLTLSKKWGVFGHLSLDPFGWYCLLDCSFPASPFLLICCFRRQIDLPGGLSFFLPRNSSLGLNGVWRETVLHFPATY